MTAIAVGEDGVHRVVGLACMDAESHASREGFLRGLREREFLRRAVRGLRRPRRHRPGGERALPGRGLAALRRPPRAGRDRRVPHEGHASRRREGASRRARRGGPGMGPRALPGRMRRCLQALCRRRQGHGWGRGRRARLPRIPRGPPPPHQDQQHAGSRQPRDQAQDRRGAGLPLLALAGAPGGGRAGRPERRVGRRPLYGRVGDARPGARRGVPRAHRGDAAQGGGDRAGGDARRGLGATIGRDWAWPDTNIRHTATKRTRHSSSNCSDTGHDYQSIVTLPSCSHCQCRVMLYIVRWHKYNLRRVFSYG